MAWPVGHHDRVSQPQDSPATPDQESGEASAQPAASFGGADQTSSGYGAAGQAIPGYGAASQGQSGYGAPAQSQPGYGTAGHPPPGYGTPGGQAYPSYPQPGYGQPYQPGYGQYQGYGRPYRAFEPVNGRKNPALAEWWRRLLARLIDGFILGVIFSPLWISPWSNFFNAVQNINNQYPNGGSAASKALTTAYGHFFGKIIIILIGFYVVAFLYDWIQHWQWGQTIGKRALGTRVVRDDGNPNLGAGPAGGRAALYAFAPLVPLVGSLFELLNELWLTWDPRRQCLHDKAAHTVVVKKDYQGPQQQQGSWQQGSW
jgi:uncharacterized RDD family membrane protein YckC